MLRRLHPFKLTAILLAFIVFVGHVRNVAFAAKPGSGGGGGGTTALHYQMTLLGTLGGSYSVARGMNEHGDVVGEAQEADGSWRAYVNFANADGSRRMVDLDGWIRDPNDFDSSGQNWLLRTAHSINDQGQIAATAVQVDDSGAVVLNAAGKPIHAALRINLPTPVTQGFIEEVIYDRFVYDANCATAMRINASGDICGMVDEGGYVPFVWTRETGFTVLQWQSNSGARGLTDRSSGWLTIVGCVGYSSGPAFRNLAHVVQSGDNQYALVYNSAENLTALYSRPQPIEAMDVNQSGQMAGIGIDGGNYRAFSLNAAGIKNLGTLPPVVKKTNATGSGANGVNNLGHVVGWSQEYGTWNQPAISKQPFIYIEGQGMINLQSAIVNFDDVKVALGHGSDGFAYALNPRDINDAGLICGPSVYSNWNGFAGQAWVLTPLP